MAHAATQGGKHRGCRACGHPRAPRIGWARLLKRVFEIDMAHCPDSGGALRIIAVIREAPVIERILTHLGLQPRASPRAPARQMPLPVG